MPDLLCVVRTSTSRLQAVKGAINTPFVDIAFSAYDGGDIGDPSFVHHYPGGKWEGLFDFFEKNPDTLERYDYLWVPDDDLAVTPRAVKALLSSMREYDLWLAQPALSTDSQISWPITLVCPGFQLRYTSFVELMAPCFKASFLRQLLPLFKDRRTAYGLDQYWACWTDAPARRCAIIDEAPIRHPVRKVDSGLYRSRDEPFKERDRCLALYTYPYPPRIVTGAVLTDGTVMPAGRELSKLYFRTVLQQLIVCEGMAQPSRLLRLIRELRRNSRTTLASELSVLPLPEIGPSLQML